MRIKKSGKSCYEIEFQTIQNIDVKKRDSVVFFCQNSRKKTDSNGISESKAKRFFFSEKGFKKAPNGKQLYNRTFEKSFATAERLLLLQEFMFRGQNVLDIFVDIIALPCSALLCSALLQTTLTFNNRFKNMKLCTKGLQ